MKYTGQQYFKTLNELSNVLSNVLDEYLFEADYFNVYFDDNGKGKIIDQLIRIIEDDILALVKGDPASRKNKDSGNDSTIEIEEEDVNYVISSYKSLNAVIMYRVAHFIYTLDNFLIEKEDYEEEDVRGMNSFLRGQARKLSEDTKAKTGVEIHPAAKIGLSFVIDHGYGTVIGETCEIGNECYILQGVTLGAREVNEKHNKTVDGRRHPKLGNKVVVCGFARIFGPIEIGDDSFICAHAVIDRNIPSGSKVRISNQIQIVKPNLHTIVIYGLHPKENGIEIIGRNLSRCNSVEILNSEGILVDSIKVDLNKTDNSLFLRFNNVELGNVIESGKDAEGKNREIYHYMISINIDDENILLKNSTGWNDFVDEIKERK